MSEAPTEGSGNAERSYAGVAAMGSAANSLQWLLNKVVTAVAMLAIARFLVPDDYGVANQALAIAQFVTILFPLTMGDVLLSHPKRIREYLPTARRLALGAALFTGLVILAGIPIFTSVYSDYDKAWLGGLLALVAFRPLLDALVMEPLVLMRMDLRFRSIAAIDGAVQLGATAFALGCAAFGGRGTALVLPQVVATWVRGRIYRRRVSTPPHGPFDRDIARTLLRQYVPGAGAQYLHNVLVLLEILVLGLACGDFQTGIYAFAFQVAAQANTVIAYQLGVVLQPIFGHLQDDPTRQVAGFLKAQRVLGLVCVPLSLAQAAIAEPLFRVAFPERYAPAVAVFQVISLAQGFYFATGPSMACLRSQRRFGTFFMWQAVQMAISVPAYWLAARWDSEHGALGVAITSAVIWTISSPIVVLLTARNAPGRHAGACLGAFVKPWALSLPVFVALWLLTRYLESWSPLGDWISLLVLAPAAILMSLLVAAWLDRDLGAMAASAIRSVQARWSRNR
jgi:PST family polysaccharide transporter